MNSDSEKKGQKPFFPFQVKSDQPLPDAKCSQTLEALACAEKQDFYLDPVTGYLVMTSFYHKNRGYCCQSQCRHCPYKE